MKTKTVLGTTAVCFVILSCKKTEAGFSADKTEAYVGEIVHFFDDKEKRKNCDFLYDYGDGTNSESNFVNIYPNYYNTAINQDNSGVTNGNPSHVYLTAGTYEVTQTVYKYKNKEKGRSSSASARLKITIRPIQCDFMVSDTVCAVGSKVYLNNTTFLPASVYSNSFIWNFINTTYPNSMPNGASVVYVPNSSNSSITDAYLTLGSPGTWKIILSQNGVSNGVSIPKAAYIRVF